MHRDRSLVWEKRIRLHDRGSLEDKRNQAMTNELPDDRPLVVVAALCEKILRETDGTLSAIRIVDRFTLQSVGDAPPPAPAQILMHALLSFKSGAFKDAFDVTFRVVRPSGKVKALPNSFPAKFEGGTQGVNFMISFVLLADERGLHAFDAMRGEQVLARIPFTLVDAPDTPSADQPPDSVILPS